MKLVERPWYRWVLLAMAWLLYVAFGLVVRSLAPLVTPISEELKLSYVQMGVIMGAWPLTYIVGALVGGVVIDRWGIRKSLFTGIVIIGLSAALRFFANGFAAMFFCVALFGLGGPLISVGGPKTIAVWFSGKERAIAIGTYTTGPWVGAIIAYSTTNSIIMPLTGQSWRLTFVLFGLVALIVGLLWWLLARDKPLMAASERASTFEVFSRLIRLPLFQLVLVMGFFGFAVSHGFNDWIPKILESRMFTPAVAGFLASIPNLSGVASRLMIPYLTPAHLRGRIVALLSVAVAGALLLIMLGSSQYSIGGLVLYGLAFSAVLPMLTLVIMETPEISAKYVGSATGIYFCIAEIGGFVGPFVIGAIVEKTGNFVAGISFSIALSLVMAVMALWLKVRPPVVTEGQAAATSGK